MMKVVYNVKVTSVSTTVETDVKAIITEYAGYSNGPARPYFADGQESNRDAFYSAIESLDQSKDWIVVGPDGQKHPYSATAGIR